MHHSFFLALNLPLGKRSVMHLVARENLPEPPSQGRQIMVTCKLGNYFYVVFKTKYISLFIEVSTQISNFDMSSSNLFWDLLTFQRSSLSFPNPILL